jgi:YHS domain-containing protein
MKGIPGIDVYNEKTMRQILSLLSVVLLFTITSNAQSGQKAGNLNLDEKNLALDGYDPVSYFKENKAVRGKSSIVAEDAGVKYQFASQENKNLFLASPSSYKPQYGGWCAYAMGAKAEKVEVDPETFKIVEGKLYLFYNKLFTNTLDSWNKKEAALKASADKNWLKISSH